MKHHAQFMWNAGQAFHRLSYTPSSQGSSDTNEQTLWLRACACRAHDSPVRTEPILQLRQRERSLIISTGSSTQAQKASGHLKRPLLVSSDSKETPPLHTYSCPPYPGLFSALHFYQLLQEGEVRPVHLLSQHKEGSGRTLSLKLAWAI